MQNFIKIGQTVLKISQFFDFQDGRHPPTWIFNFIKFLLKFRLEGLMCIAVPNFTKIG